MTDPYQRCPHGSFWPSDCHECQVEADLRKRLASADFSKLEERVLAMDPIPTLPGAPAAPTLNLALDPDIAKILHQNLWNLYVEEPLAAPSAPVNPTAACVEAMQMALNWLEDEQSATDEDCGHPGCDECEGVTRPRQRVIDALRAQIEKIGGGRCPSNSDCS